MRWLRIYAKEPQWTGDPFMDHMIASVEASMRGTVLDEAPALIRLASDQHVGLFVRPLLPRSR
jgi:hypothetical protein